MTMSINAVRDYTGRGESGSSSLRITPQADPGLKQTDGRVTGTEGPERQSFGDMVKEFAGDVNELQFESGRAVNQFVTGEAADVHQVMVAVRRAGIAMDLMLEIRNKALEGYQELIRMQV